MVLVWWYTTGLLALLRQLRAQALGLARSLNLDVMIRYLFVPMYGYNDAASRTISFVVRLVQLVVISIFTLIYIVFEVIVLIFWVALPVVVLGNLVYQLTGLVWNR